MTPGGLDALELAQDAEREARRLTDERRDDMAAGCDPRPRSARSELLESVAPGNS
jgi:hypothetical protein